MTGSQHAEQQLTVEHVKYGDLILDELGQKYRVEKVEKLDHGVYLWKAGQGYPEFYLNGSKMTRYYVIPDPKPFKVYTRRYKANGDCIKGIREFKTRKAQGRYILNAPADVAITFYN